MNIIMNSLCYGAYRYFNSLQSECFPTCYHSDVNMVISAPTGSGKTVLFELCILRLLAKSISSEGRFIHVKGSLKTVSNFLQDFGSENFSHNNLYE